MLCFVLPKCNENPFSLSSSGLTQSQFLIVSLFLVHKQLQPRGMWVVCFNCFFSFSPLSPIRQTLVIINLCTGPLCFLLQSFGKSSTCIASQLQWLVYNCVLDGGNYLLFAEKMFKCLEGYFQLDLTCDSAFCKSKKVFHLPSFHYRGQKMW